ncbi:MAG: glycosyltransferase [Alphaproteobacteria bacterium]|nr:glycosyltransferase [Alphaproteobacteria bacterium]
MVLFVLSMIAAAAWICMTLANGMFWLPLLPGESRTATPKPSVDIVVPARNEASILPLTLPTLLAQAYAGDWKILLVDDHSTDGTAEIARKIAQDMKRSERLTVIAAPDLPAGWSGKVAAMNAGVAQSKADYILFTDADIRHSRLSLERLTAHAIEKKLDLVSRMVKLNCESFAEKLLIPAFVFFFMMLYPFRRANAPLSPAAAAAGGVMLLKKSMLDRIGGLSRIKSALIDDCTLAKAVKNAGGAIELTLTQEIRSVRPYPRIKDVWAMIARTAYTQLHYSPFLLIATVAGLSFLFLMPCAAIVLASDAAAIVGGYLSLFIMAGIYMPMVRFYDLSPLWAFTLPVAAIVYAGATMDSARRYHLGNGGQRKGRSQA